MLFVSSHQAPERWQRLEVLLTMPFGSQVRCVGRVARTTSAEGGKGAAVRIERSWFRRRTVVDGHATAKHGSPDDRVKRDSLLSMFGRVVPAWQGEVS